MRKLAHLQTRIFDTPLAIQPKKLEIILTAIGNRIGLNVSDEDAAQAAATTKPTNKPDYQVVQGVAVIPVCGTLMKSTSGLQALSGCTSYEQLTNQFRGAMDNPAVNAVLLDVDSPGGEVHGMLELADLIYDMRGVKPIYGVANDNAFSAAYALISACDKVFVTRTGGVGSIGVFCMHVDQSEADKQAGMKFTYIHAGAKKTDGNPHEPLSEQALNDAQGEVDREYGLFCSLVSRNRGIKLETVKHTEAGTYFAENSVPMLADAVGTLQDAFAELVQKSSAINIDYQTVGNQASTQDYSLMKRTKTQVEAPLAENANETPVAETVAVEVVAATEEVVVAAAKVEEEEESCNPSAVVEDTTEEEEEKIEEEEEMNAKASFLRIINLCSLAGHTDLAANYINAGMNVKQVEKALLEKRTNMSKENTLNTTLTAPVGAFDTLNGLAKEVKGTKGKKSDAYARMLMANSESYMTYLEERDEACGKGLNSKATRTYLAEMESKVRGY